tara:strand:+ start:1914 stop:2045 length:132 start_codon:yes stop_codon:yes gene_type:complete
MEELINKVIDQIEKDLFNGDSTAIEQLIKDIPVENLTSFLSEV